MLVKRQSFFAIFADVNNRPCPKCCISLQVPGGIVEWPHTLRNYPRGTAVMRRILAYLLLSLGLFAAGCSLHEALFGLFGTYHSDGYSRGDREDSYERSVP